MNLLDNRIAIITGGARGIGLALSQIMVMQGAKVVIADNGCATDGSPEDPVVAEAATARCNQISAGSAVAFNDNLADPTAPGRLAEFAKAQFGYIDILINNAAVTRPDALLLGDRAAFEFVIANNLTTAYALTAAVAPVMRTQFRTGRLPGSIVNVIGASGIYGDHDFTANSVANSGLIGLTRSTALQLKAHGINCNAVMAFAATRQTLAIKKSSSDTDLVDYIRAETQIAPSYAANLLAWLASPQAGAISGQIFGARGREILLFNQSRPVRSVFTGAGALDADALAQSVMDQFASELTELCSSIQSWSDDPIL
jgi:NAD(P)-dependent dehydrogenase (short-subunit alcohol dehydrogenase family)